VEKSGRVRQAADDNIIRRMRFAYWITKATNTFIMCSTYCFSTAPIVTRTLLNATSYIHCPLSLILRVPNVNLICLSAAI
jgi:hypothetical protein